MQTPLTLDDLQAYMDRHRIEARLIGDIGHTPTVPAAAQVLGVATEQIIKTLLFVLEPGSKEGIPPTVVVIANGENRVDKRLLGRHFGLNPKRVKLADPAVVLDLLGYPAGGVPPFGHRTQLPVLVDSAVAALRERDDGRIFGGGGDDQTMMELSVSTLLEALHEAQIVTVSHTATG
jgi:prolyl-tRNA editing enzyme YbaK/EbsC (Cys-tRNA(Pro) deacylase)